MSEDLRHDASFLLTRLRDIEPELSEDQVRDWWGHVVPSMERLQMLCTSPPSACRNLKRHVHRDIGVCGPVDGMNSAHPNGSYMRLVLTTSGDVRDEVLISLGATEVLVAELIGLLEKIGRIGEPEKQWVPSALADMDLCNCNIGDCIRNYRRCRAEAEKA